MNIFQSAKTIFKALSDNYNSSRELQQHMEKQQESLLNEAMSKALLETQLRGYIEYHKEHPKYYAILIEIADECLPFVDEVADILSLECTLTPGSEKGRFLLEFLEEEL